MREDIRPFLSKITKPGRYTGGEQGSVFKDLADVKMRVAFCFPDTYEIGMSNLGMRILTEALNAVDGVWCERVYAPWTDMQAEMRARGIPLFTHESGDAVGDFDVVAFTLQYEMCYTTVLNMMDLAGIPLRAESRGADAPIILAGGPCAYNPEPMAPFVDIFSIGEGEEALPELARLYLSMKENGTFTKEAFLRAASHLDGFYVPSLYDIAYHADGTIASITPKYEDVPAKIVKRIVADVDHTVVPTAPVMPLIETVQDRVTLEVYRGCVRGCRFCQAGFISRPVREKSVPVLCDFAKATVENTGYEEISLMSLSISDYTDITALTDALLRWTNDRQINLSLPSLRADSFTKELMEKISSVRTSTLTFAPEAGTQRLRDVINKNVSEEEILNACRIAFAAGKNQVKLYFMIGLPGETDEDLAGIAQIAKHVIDAFYETPERNRARPPQVTISAACFIPKPMTPFQWEGQDTMESLERKQKFVLSQIRDRKIRFNYHDASTSHVEAVLARGDRRVADALELAHKEGMCFDAWEEFFNYEKWMDVFARAGVDPAFYANRSIPDGEILPWDMIDCGVSREFLLRERHKSQVGTPTPGCHDACSACGVNSLVDAEKCTWCPGGKMRPKSGEGKAPAVVSAPTETVEKPAAEMPVKVEYRPIRVRFAKEEPALYIGHLDLARIMAHIITRSALPVYYSEGFNPRPKIVFASPLSVGTGGSGEVMDLRIRADLPNEEVLARLSAAAPAGVRIIDVYDRVTKLTDIEWARSSVVIHSPRADEAHAAWITERFKSPVVMLKKSKSGEKEVDITTLIRDLRARYDAQTGTVVIEAITASSAQNYLNPSYIVDAIAKESDLITDDTWHEITREALLTENFTEFA
ncbi:MAG: TIGR03960 family B12-binding radical SAM protein [Clostridia bacterium]|nr:TIGR03960 family B12-binding radical SAM protein [Clostridia bacterium]